MKPLKAKDQEQLPRHVAEMGGAGQAENEPDDRFLRRFLPLPEHAKALQPNVALVVGDRGTGKTELSRATSFPEGLRAILQQAASQDLPAPERCAWRVGYSASGTKHPPELVFREFALQRDSPAMQTAWLGLLLGTLADDIRRDLPADAPVAPLMTIQPSDLATLYDATRGNLASVFGLVDDLDRKLAQQDQWIFVVYDELDRVSAHDWAAMSAILRGLVQFWSSNVRRWSRVRPKIFLRRDIFQRVALVGLDVSKLAGQRVELIWSVSNLYKLAAKRLVNQHERSQAYFAEWLKHGEVDSALGWIPANLRAAEQRGFFERLGGENMGANPKKGKTFKWIPNHLQDGHGRILPRSMLRFFEASAEIELDNRKAEWPRLLHHTSMRAAVDKVSEHRVSELEEEEFRWLKHVREALGEARPEVPLERAKLEATLTIDWSQHQDKPPETAPRELLKLLVELGLFYEHQDGRVNARDLYLKGLGLKRKGGVAQPF